MAGADEVEDGIKRDIAAMRDERPGPSGWREFHEASWSSLWLPARYAHDYTPEFLQRFLDAVRRVRRGLDSDEGCLLNSVLEELAMRAILEEADLSEDARERMEEAVFEDTDHEYLFFDGTDGIEDTPAGQDLGIGPLRLSEWDDPFRELTAERLLR